MNRFVLRAGGLHIVVIYACLLAFLAIGLLGNLSDLHNYGHVDWTIVEIIAGILILVGIFFAWAFLRTKIRIDGDNMFINPVQKFVLKNILGYRFLNPTSSSANLKIESIQSIFIGEMGTKEELLKMSDSDQIKSFYGYYRYSTMGLDSGWSFVFVRMPRWIASKHMPIIFIQAKDSRNSLIISAKPFSKKGLRAFVQMIKDRGVEITTEKYLGLE